MIRNVTELNFTNTELGIVIVYSHINKKHKFTSTEILNKIWKDLHNLTVTYCVTNYSWISYCLKFSI